MQEDKQPNLKHISSKHLIDIRSDQVYTPFRDVNSRVLAQKYKYSSSQYKQFQKISEISLIPAKLQGLQISTQPIDHFKKFRKIAQREKSYSPIQQGILKNLIQTNTDPEQITYKYTNLHSKTSGKLKSVPVFKDTQNRSNFGKNMDEKIKIIDQAKQKNHSYNLFSFLDEPFNYLRQKL